MKLSQWAKKNNYTYRGAFNVWKRGAIPNARQLSTGTIVIDEPVEVKEKLEEHTVIYARVSSSENKSNLDSQAERLVQFCTARGWVVKQVIKECASGLNDRRPKLAKLLVDQKVTRVVVEHKDRLTRFGFEYIKLLFKGDLVVANESTDDQTDLMQDFVSLVTCFCARLYGQRRSKRKTTEIIAAIK